MRVMLGDAYRIKADGPSPVDKVIRLYVGIAPQFAVNMEVNLEHCHVVMKSFSLSLGYDKLHYHIFTGMETTFSGSCRVRERNNKYPHGKQNE